MKKRALIASFSAVAIAFMIFALVFIISTMRDADTENHEPTPIRSIDSTVTDTNAISNPSYITASKITGYMMKGENSAINIYEIYDNGNYQVIDTLQINPATLPEADRDRLSGGIVLESYEKMCHLIEDYSS